MEMDYCHVAASAAKAHAQQLRADGDMAPCTLVLGRIGDSAHPRCYADVFDGGILTVTSADDQMQQATYPPGVWREASVYGHDGHLIYTLVSLAPVCPLSRQCLSCEQSAWFVQTRPGGTQEFRCANGHVTVSMAIAPERLSA